MTPMPLGLLCRMWLADTVDIVLAAWLKLWRGLGPLGLRAEVAHLLITVVPIAAGALILGQSWKVVAVVSITAVLTAAGWNSDAAVPPLVPAAQAVPPRTEP